MGDGLKGYYKGKIEELELLIKDKSHNLRRLEAQRNELNTQGQTALSLPWRAPGGQGRRAGGGGRVPGVAERRGLGAWEDAVRRGTSRREDVWGSCS